MIRFAARARDSVADAADPDRPLGVFVFKEVVGAKDFLRRRYSAPSPAHWAAEQSLRHWRRRPA
jgi:hypothetical protein